MTVAVECPKRRGHGRSIGCEDGTDLIKAGKSTYGIRAFEHQRPGLPLVPYAAEKCHRYIPK
jgi:hypothetical protein